MLFFSLTFKAGTCHPAGSVQYVVQPPVVSIFVLFVCLLIILLIKFGLNVGCTPAYQGRFDMILF